MATYFTFVIVAVLAACSMKSPPFDEWAQYRSAAAAYPETRSTRVHVSEVHMRPPHSNPHAAGVLLAGFSHRASVGPNQRAELDGFSVLYQAPNRNPQVAEPYLPPTVPDRVLIVRDSKPLVDQELLPGFTGIDNSRTVEAARIHIGGRPYLLLVSRAEQGNPMWVGIFGTRGEVLYRGALPNGIYHFTENRHGVTFVDDAGFGKRVVLL